MGIFIYGISKTPINLDEFFIKCPSCETNSWADIMVESNYTHFYFVPMFPTEKEANCICKKCGLKRYGIPFDQNLISNYNEVRRNYRHPWFTYIGITLIILILIILIVSVIF